MGKKDKKYHFKMNKILEAGYKHENNITLDLPEKIEKLPSVSVLTITKNRSRQFELSIHNWLNFLYPKELIEWIIVDDSDDNSLFDIIEQLQDTRIKYFHTKNFLDVAIKRNFSVEKSTGEILVNMDDDDYHYPDSILAKIRCLEKYKKKCLFSSPIGVYNINNDTSQIIESEGKIPGIPEATMAFYRSFWDNSPKFAFKNGFAGEGINMVLKQDKKLLKLPYFFNCICFTHKKNITSGMRDLNIADNEKCMNFKDLFPPEVVYIINKWVKLN